MPTPAGAALWNIMQPFLQGMTDRVLDAVNFYRDHFAGGRPLSQIIISGGGANMSRVDELLSELAKTSRQGGSLDQHRPEPLSLAARNHPFEHDGGRLWRSVTCSRRRTAPPQDAEDQKNRKRMISLNLLSPAQKEALEARIVYALLERLMILIVASMLVATIVLLGVKIELTQAPLGHRGAAERSLPSTSRSTRDGLAQSGGRAHRQDQTYAVPVTPMFFDLFKRVPSGLQLNSLSFDAKERRDEHQRPRRHPRPPAGLHRSAQGSPYVKKRRESHLEPFPKDRRHLRIAGHHHPDRLFHGHARMRP